ncbi:MAG: hypothetical protein JSS83_17975 [Cyanobacteria bacterium SZAS LIN-3]|nr:hypothetical protein [Cyanobacteria bacterium SZAS LIN-3]
MDTVHHYWDQFNRALAQALHELLYLPDCCMNLITHSPEDLRALRQHSHQPHCRDAHTDQEAAEEQAHICRRCGEDIVSRAQTSQAHQSAVTSHTTFHDWMQNDGDRLVMYGDTPNSAGYDEIQRDYPEFKDGHLQRVEQYWYDHQLQNPTCAPKKKTSCCVSPDEWRRTQEQAALEEERDRGVT